MASLNSLGSFMCSTVSLLTAAKLAQAGKQASKKQETNTDQSREAREQTTTDQEEALDGNTVSLDVATHKQQQGRAGPTFEIGMVGAPHEHEGGRLGRRQIGPRLSQPGQGDLPVVRLLASDGVDDDVDVPPLFQKVQAGLLDADVGLDAKDDDGGGAGGESL